MYDPFLRGSLPVGVRTISVHDRTRERAFPCEVWYPAGPAHAGADLTPETQDAFTVPFRETPVRQEAVRDAAALRGTYPLIVFSHFSGGHRRASTFLCTHLSSHGYIVAAVDHSEVVAPELARKTGETADERAARTEGWIASRPPDIHAVLRSLLDENGWESPATIDRTRIGLVGHSFGGWTVLRAAGEDPSVRAVVGLAPGGGDNPRPGVLALTLDFRWDRDLPTLYLVAEDDVSMPLAGMRGLFARTPGSKRMFILRRADHLHFIDNVAQDHEFVRTMQFPPEMTWMREMRPATELTGEQEAHAFTRGLTLSHFDAYVSENAAARHFLEGDIAQALLARGIDAVQASADFTTESC